MGAASWFYQICWVAEAIRKKTEGGPLKNSMADYLPTGRRKLKGLQSRTIKPENALEDGFWQILPSGILWFASGSRFLKTCSLTLVQGFDKT